MARIAGVNIPKEKRIVASLTYIFGIGPMRAKQIVAEADLNPSTRTYKLTEDEVNKIRAIVESKYSIEGELRREITFNIKRLKEIGSYRGSRHAKNLPVRGQRTKTNSRTRHGNVRRTMGSGRTKSAQKT